MVRVCSKDTEGGSGYGWTLLDGEKKQMVVLVVLVLCGWGKDIVLHT